MREDVRTLLHSTARPPTMEIDPDGLWRRGRRRRHRVNAAVTAVTVLALAVAAIAVTRLVAPPVSYVRVNESAPGADVGDGRRVRGVGAVIVGPDGRAEFCQALHWNAAVIDLVGSSPSCAHGPGVALTGVTVGQVPDPQTDHGVVWGRAAVTGTLTADGVEVDRVDPAPPNDAPVDDRSFAPEDLERIWAVQLAPEVDAVVGYTQDHVDEFGGAWWEDDTVFVFAFTGHVDDHPGRHRPAVAARVPCHRGPLHRGRARAHAGRHHRG